MSILFTLGKAFVVRLQIFLCLAFLFASRGVLASEQSACIDVKVWSQKTMVASGGLLTASEVAKIVLKQASKNAAARLSQLQLDFAAQRSAVYVVRGSNGKALKFISREEVDVIFDDLKSKKGIRVAAAFMESVERYFPKNPVTEAMITAAKEAVAMIDKRAAVYAAKLAIPSIAGAAGFSMSTFAYLSDLFLPDEVAAGTPEEYYLENPENLVRLSLDNPETACGLFEESPELKSLGKKLGILD